MRMQYVRKLFEVTRSLTIHQKRTANETDIRKVRELVKNYEHIIARKHLLHGDTDNYHRDMKRSLLVVATKLRRYGPRINQIRLTSMKRIWCVAKSYIETQPSLIPATWERLKNIEVGLATKYLLNGNVGVYRVRMMDEAKRFQNINN